MINFRQEITDVVGEVKLSDLTSDELRDLLTLMTAGSQRVRASKVVPLKLVHSTDQPASRATDVQLDAVTYGPALAEGCSVLDAPARMR